MNTLLVDALVDAILALSPEEQRLVQEKLQLHKGGAEVHPTEEIQMGREERIRQQDEFLQTLFPTYTPPQEHYEFNHLC